jgi:hypothetical protein
MGTKTLTTFLSELTFELFNRTDLASYTTGWINDAYLDFLTRSKFWGLRLPHMYMFPELDVRALDTTVASTAYIVRPADCLIPYSIWDMTNDKHLTYRSWRWYIDQTGRGTSTAYGKPDYWTPYGDAFYLYKTPDTAYTLTIYYRKRPALLTDGEQKTEIGAEWDLPILKLAVIQSLMRLKDYEAAEKEKKEWLAMMSEKIGVYEEQEKDMKKVFGPDYAYLTYNKY